MSNSTVELRIWILSRKTWIARDLERQSRLDFTPAPAAYFEFVLPVSKRLGVGSSTSSNMKFVRDEHPLVLAA
jgi:hypothetical protein